MNTIVAPRKVKPPASTMLRKKRLKVRSKKTLGVKCLPPRASSSLSTNRTSKAWLSLIKGCTTSQVATFRHKGTRVLWRNQAVLSISIVLGRAPLWLGRAAGDQVTKPRLGTIRGGKTLKTNRSKHRQLAGFHRLGSASLILEWARWTQVSSMMSKTKKPEKRESKTTLIWLTKSLPRT